MKINKILLAIVVVVLLAGVIYWLNSGNKNNINSGNLALPSSNLSLPSTSPSVSPLKTSKNPSVSPPLNSGGIQDTVPYSQLTKAAECGIKGNINFVSQSMAQDNASLNYTGIDSPTRQIYWHISPQDDLKVGPNLVASLKIPDDSSQVIVTLPEYPKAKKYILTTSITYGRQVGQDVKVSTTDCSGQIEVNLNY
jgi:hypothetical protein